MTQKYTTPTTKENKESFFVKKKKTKAFNLFLFGLIIGSIIAPVIYLFYSIILYYIFMLFN